MVHEGMESAQSACRGGTLVTISRKAYLAALITVVFWSSAFVGIRIGLGSFNPYHLVLLRFLVASLVFIVLVPVFKIRPLPRKTWPRVIVSGVVGLTIYHTALSIGEQTVNPATASFIIAGAPIISAIFASQWLKEKYTRLGWLGVVISFLGVLVITGFGSSFHSDALLIVLSTVATSIYFIVEKPLLATYRTLDVTAWVTWAGTLPMLLYWHGFLNQLSAATVNSIGWVVYIGIFPAAVAYLTWNIALAHADANQVTPFLYLSPILAAGLSWVMLHQVPGWPVWIGGLFVLAGVILVQRYGKPRGPILEDLSA